MDLLTIIFYVVGLLLCLTIGYLVAKKEDKPKKETCNLTVVSIDTGYSYHAVSYRMKSNIMEIEIYNYHTRKYEWYSVYHFKDPFKIIFQITKNLELSYYLAYGINTKKLTQGQK